MRNVIGLGDAVPQDGVTEGYLGLKARVDEDFDSSRWILTRSARAVAPLEVTQCRGMDGRRLQRGRPPTNRAT